MTTPEPQARPMVLLPATKGQRIMRLKDSIDKIQKDRDMTLIEYDVARSTVLAEALGEECLDGTITQKDLGEATGISQMYVAHLLRYSRFLTFWRSLDKAIALSMIPEGRFRDYWKQMSDAQDIRHIMHDAQKRDAYERRVFLTIIEWLEAGKAPLKKPKPPEKPTVQQMFTKKKPLLALRKELERRYTEEFKSMAATLRDYLGRDRSTFTPTLQASAAIALDKWEKSLEGLLKDFDNYVQD